MPTVAPLRELTVERKSADQIISELSRTTDEVFSSEELKTRLTEGASLRMKYGVDLTAPLLHTGHAVNLWMYRELQEQGHKVVFLLGDFTTQIGDPTGRSKTRPVLSKDEIEKNAEEFMRQVKMVLLDDAAVFEVRRNSEWYDKMSPGELLSLMSTVTLDRLLSRDMFQKRMKESLPIYTHELIYPILQGYDSVMLKADLTIVGSDQLFNEMMGRFFQEKFNQRPQVIVTSTLTPGIDGKEKQSKSLGNYIGLGHSPQDKFGRAMSIPDTLIAQYFKVYTKVPFEEFALDKIEKDPMKLKKRLAYELVKRYHGEATANIEIERFTATFSRKEVPTDAPQVSFGAERGTVIEILRKCLTDKSGTQLRQLIKEGAIRHGEDALTDATQTLELPPTGLLLRAGKRNWYLVIPN